MSEDEKLTFEKLTPVDNCCNGVYSDAVDYALNENDIKNVAITGTYGSGKSSMIKSYEKNRNKHFAYISLANFNPSIGTPKPNQSNDIPKTSDIETSNKKKHNKKNNEEKIEKILEARILNQLLHQIDPNRIPLTIFKTKKNYQNIIDKSSSYAMYLLSIIILISVLWKHEYWINLLGQNPAGNLNYFGKIISSHDFISITILLLLIVGYCGIQKLITAIIKNKTSLKKVGFSGVELEILENSDISYFDKHLSEVIYLFRESGYDVFVFEDIDRYNSVKIFERLREINYIINCKREKPIKFFYMVKDDIMNFNERTKFFDFIIPVIPFITCANSRSILMKRLEKVEPQIDKYFIKAVSYYIEDMRVLRSIMNEFKIYVETLCQEQENDNTKLVLDKTKLLALVIYKNLFPSDFSALQSEESYINYIFKKKKQFIEPIINTYDIKIKEIDDDIERSKNEHLNDMNELDAIYTMINYSPPHDIECNTRAEFISEVKNNNLSTVYHGRRYTTDVKNTYDSELVNLQENHEYLQRKKYIENKSENKKQELNNQKNELKQKILKVNNSPLRDILEHFNDKENDILQLSSKDCNKFNCIVTSKCFPLIRHLLSDGHIDEGYHDYISYFHEGDLCKDDKQFVINLLSGQPNEPSVLLRNIGAIIEDIKENYFSKPSVLNIYLVKYLIENNRTEPLDIIIKQLRENKHIDFVEKLLDLIYSSENAIELLNYERTIELLCVSPYEFDDLSKIKNASDLLEHVILNNQYVQNQTNMDIVLSTLYHVTGNLESEENAVKILNSNESLSFTKEMYLTNYKIEIKHIKKITEKSVVKMLLDKKLVVSEKIDDIIYCFECNDGKLNVNIISLINQFNNEPDFTEIQENIKKDLFLAIIKENAIDNHIYKKFIVSLNEEYGEIFDIKGIADEKIDILIECKQISMTSENLNFIRENYNRNLIKFISNNIEKYVELDKNNADNDEEHKNILISNTDDNIKEKIVDIASLSILSKTYCKQSDKLKKYIIDDIVKHINILMENNIALPFEIICNIPKGKIFYKQLEKLLINTSSHPKKNEIIDFFEKNKKTGIVNALKRAKKSKSLSPELYDFFKKNGYMSTEPYDFFKKYGYI